MASFEPVVVLFGSIKNISSLNFRLPVSFVFAIDEPSLEELVTTSPQLSDTCLRRYFVILLESVSNNILEHLGTNHRIQVIYSREDLTYVSNHSKPHRIINKQIQQFTLDLTKDIVNFYTIEGEKQAKLERLHLTRIYYRQARLLKEWAMSFAKAEPCHILVIPLNTNQENLLGAQERLQKICTKLGYPTVTVRTLAEYIPSNDENKPCLFPYSQLLFNHEHPQYICELIRKLSPIRLYLYGNETIISSEWSNLMINRETHIMDDEDNWCAFIENDYIDDDMKWNIGPMFGGKWQVKRIAPINLTELDQNLRFQSALRRAYKTFNPRQYEITSEVFDWYDKCLRDGHLQLEPKLTYQDESKGSLKLPGANNIRVQNPSLFRYRPSSKCKGMSFIWLDEILNSSNDYLNSITKSYQWNFFDNVSHCLAFIENQLREENEIFLVTSGSLGYELFTIAHRVMAAIQYVYIYCSKLGIHGNWIRYYQQIKGVFNDLTILGEKIQKDLDSAHQLQTNTNNQGHLKLTTTSLPDQDNDSALILAYNQEQVSAFVSHQRTIDTLLSLPYTDESRIEMLEEFRRLYHDNHTAMTDIDLFEQTYNSHTAIQWYTRDTFLFRTINKALRSSNVEMMFKMRSFLVDLYVQLDTIYKQSQDFHRRPIVEKLYRGQLMSKTDYDYLQQIKGEIISINTFLSTTTSLQVALSFSNSSENDDDNTFPIIFCIETNPYIEHKRPYANISQFSMYSEEEEVLFAMGSLFRIQNIQQLDRTTNIPIIYLQMIDQTEINYTQLS